MRELEPRRGRAALAAARRACSTPGEDFDRVASAAPGSSRPRRTAAWSGCCARRACPRACSSTAAPAAGLRAAGRELRLARLPRRGHDRDGGPADLRRHAPAARASAASSRCRARSGSPPSSRTAASTRTSSRPSSPSRCCTRSTSCCAASRRPTTASKASCSATSLAGAPRRGLRGLLTVLLRLVFLLYAEDREPAPRGRGLPQLLLGRRASSSGSARTPAATPTRWTSATAPGRSCSSSSGWSTTAPTRRRCALPERHGDLFDPDRYPFLEGRADWRRRGSTASGSSRRSSPTGWSTACSRTCSSSTASGSPTGRSTSSRSARSTRR